jgi:TRAP-type C4-dicarboxylate transport system permease small subunit
MLFSAIWTRIMFLMLLGMSILMTVGALLRYVFNSPLAFADEVSGLLLLGITFLGLSYAQKGGAHIRIDIIVKLLPPKIQAGLAKVNWVIEVLWSLVVLACVSLAVLDYFNTQKRSMSTDWLVYPFASVMVLGTLMLLIELVFGEHNPIRLFRKGRGSRDTASQEIVK